MLCYVMFCFDSFCFRFILCLYFLILVYFSLIQLYTHTGNLSYRDIVGSLVPSSGCKNRFVLKKVDATVERRVMYA